MYHKLFEKHSYVQPSKYLAWYLKIVDQATGREKLRKNQSGYVYYEAHHILPKCIWKKHENFNLYPWNRALLTAREHFLCHWLLTKVFSRKTEYLKMLNAFNSMRRNRNDERIYSAWRYEILRIKTSEYASSVMSDIHRGKTISAAQRIENSKQKAGKKYANQERSKRIANSKKRACTDGTTIYNSIMEMAKAIGLSDTTIRQRLLSDDFPHWKYLDKENTKARQTSRFSPCTDGINTFITRKACALHHGITSSTVENRIKSSLPEYSEWRFLTGEESKSFEWRSNKKKVFDGEIIHVSLKACSEYYNVDNGTIRYRINSSADKYREWKYI